MKLCKYCKKPILDNWVWNPDSGGNGYHHACLCEMEFRSRDRQIYDKGRADVLDKMRAEIVELWQNEPCAIEGGCLDEILEIIDKYKEEIEPQESEAEDGDDK